MRDIFIFNFFITFLVFLKNFLITVSHLYIFYDCVLLIYQLHINIITFEFHKIFIFVFMQLPSCYSWVKRLIESENKYIELLSFCCYFFVGFPFRQLLVHFPYSVMTTLGSFLFRSSYILWRKIWKQNTRLIENFYSLGVFEGSYYRRCPQNIFITRRP